MKFELVEETADILGRPTLPFDFQNPPTDPVQLVADMFETMMTFKGVGLAAPQCNLPYRMFVMMIDGVRYACFNPTISEEPGDLVEKIIAEEGCLSFPDLWLKVSRPRLAFFAYQNENGEEVHRILDGLAARCARHELDHLNGIRFTERAGALSLKHALKKRLKHTRRNFNERPNS